jgi:ABC-2 type transport system permease protein
VFVSYREKGVLRRLKATPMPLGGFVAARVLMQLVVAVIQAGLVIAVGVLAFHVSIGGWSVVAPVVLLSLVGAASFVTIGFFIAAISKNVESAAALGQVVGTPMMFLSGIFFPMDNAPAWIQPVVHAMPLKYLADAMRAVIIQGQSLWHVRWDILILSAVGMVFLALSVRFFRWE